VGERDLKGPRGAARAPRPEGASIAGWALLGLLLAALLVTAPVSAVGGAAAERLWRLGAAAALALAALACARVLGRSLGAAAPLWVAVWVFGSVAFAQVFWAPGAAILMAASALAFALVYGAETPVAEGPPEIWDAPESRAPARIALRWGPAGALLGVLAAAHPLYLGLLLPAWLAVPRGRSAGARGALVAGAVAALAGGLLLRAGFDPAHSAQLGGLGGLPLDRGLLAWNLAYFFAGRYGGVLVYCLPLLLGFLAPSWRAGRWSLPLAAGVISLGFLVLHPFAFAAPGGQAAVLGNARFLPLYPALWFVGGRRARPAAAIAIAALAAAGMHAAWRLPPPHPGDGGLSAPARRFLPPETSLRDLPGTVEVEHRGLRVRFLDAHAGPRTGGLRLRRGEEAQLLVGADSPLSTLLAEFDRQAPSGLEVRGAEVGEILFRPDGRVAFELRPRGARRHPTWWSREPAHVYHLALRLPGEGAEVGFTLTPGGRARAGGGG
jgi:hypothetical protein